MGVAFAYDTYTNPSKNNGVLRATLTEKPPFLFAVQGIVGGIEIQDQHLAVTGQAAHTELKQRIPRMPEHPKSLAHPVAWAKAARLDFRHSMQL